MLHDTTIPGTCDFQILSIGDANDVIRVVATIFRLVRSIDGSADWKFAVPSIIHDFRESPNDTPG